MKKTLLVAICCFMFFFKNNVMGNYEKVFFDFQIQSINGEIIDFKNYRNKAILVVNKGNLCCFTKF